MDSVDKLSDTCQPQREGAIEWEWDLKIIIKIIMNGAVFENYFCSTITYTKLVHTSSLFLTMQPDFGWGDCLSLTLNEWQLASLSLCNEIQWSVHRLSGCCVSNWSYLELHLQGLREWAIGKKWFLATHDRTQDASGFSLIVSFITKISKNNFWLGTPEYQQNT